MLVHVLATCCAAAVALRGAQGRAQPSTGRCLLEQAMTLIPIGNLTAIESGALDCTADGCPTGGLRIPEYSIEAPASAAGSGGAVLPGTSPDLTPSQVRDVFNVLDRRLVRSESYCAQTPSITECFPSGTGSVVDTLHGLSLW